MTQVNAYYYKCFLIVWIDRFECWAILNDRGEKVREPYWGTTAECKQAIDSGEAL